MGQTVHIGGWQWDAHEVTIGQVKAYAQATGFVSQAERAGGGSVYESGWTAKPGWTWRTPFGVPARDDEPAVHLDFDEAQAICKHFGKRLPTDAQWTAAAYREQRTTPPTGWAICDGGNYSGRQTPDLRGRFVVGAGQGPGLSNRTLGIGGGSETVTLAVGQLPAHNHVVKGETSESGDHTHTLPRVAYDDGNGCCMGDGAQGLWGDSGTRTWNALNASAGAGNHRHSFTTTSDSTGSGSPVDNMPPFYALAFIMRVQ